MPVRQRDDAEIARILADADTLGDKAAAEKHGITDRQIRRYRAAALKRPDLACKVLENRAALQDMTWLQAARYARREALTKLAELVRRSKSLREVAGALKIIHDAVVAEELLGADDEQRRPSDGVAESEGPDSEAEGERGTTH